ncbi:G-protein coupled receptor 161-like [Amphiura filiformis]|uniref:G-protein coupled receptor 161-like n=1 Tax=Amphiura filiformis TaxID=82378 RepID=UPI003B219D7B
MALPDCTAAANITACSIQWNDSKTSVEDSRNAATVITQAVSIGVIMLLSIIGNSLVLLAIYKNPALQNKTAIFIANIAIADFTNGCIGMPFLLVSTITNNWPFSDALCSFTAAITIILCAVSIGTLGSIAHDRYCAIVYPLKYHELMSKTKIVFFLAWIWIQAVVIAICPLLGWSEYIYIQNEYLCTANWGQDISYTLSLTIFYSLGPMTVMLYCYIRILMVARRHSRQITALKTSVAHQTEISTKNTKRKRTSILSDPSIVQFRKDAKSAFILFIVIAVFLICWMPHLVTMYAIAFGYNGFTDAFYTATTWLSMTNSMLNPILYGVLNRQYRTAFKQLLFGTVIKNRDHGLIKTRPAGDP